MVGISDMPEFKALVFQYHFHWMTTTLEKLSPALLFVFYESYKE